MTSSPNPGRSLWRHPDFLKLWTGDTISQFGSQISFLAIPLVAIKILVVTPFEIGLLGTIEFLPFIIFALPAGAWVDRLRRRPILIAGDLGRALSLASVPIAYQLGVLSIWQLYLVGFVNGVCTVFFDVAYQSYVPSLVERDQIVDANSKLEISRSAAQIGGPGMSGVLIGIVTAPIAIIGDALSFVVSAAAVFAIRKRESTPDRHHDEHGRRRGSMRSEIASGLRYVTGHRYLRSIAASTGWSNLFTTMAFAVYLLYVVRILGMSEAAIGFVFAVGNIGTIVGAFAARPLANRLGVGRTIILSMALAGPGTLLIAVAPTENPIPFLIGAGLLFGFAAMAYNINQVSFRQAITPRAHAGPDERHDAVHRLGHDPAGERSSAASWAGSSASARRSGSGRSGAGSPSSRSLSSVRPSATMPKPVEEDGAGRSRHGSEPHWPPRRRRQHRPAARASARRRGPQRVTLGRRGRAARAGAVAVEQVLGGTPSPARCASSSAA